MVRALLLGALTLVSCEARAPSATPAPTPPSAPSAPKVDGIEGHGGIAITGPSTPLGGTTPDPKAPDLALKRSLLEKEYEARQLYLQAYQLKDSDPRAAAALLRRVVALTPTSSDQHQKARARLAELGEPMPP